VRNRLVEEDGRGQVSKDPSYLRSFYDVYEFLEDEISDGSTLKQAKAIIRYTRGLKLSESHLWLLYTEN
jgi:hypothetical protein